MRSCTAILRQGQYDRACDDDQTGGFKRGGEAGAEYPADQADGLSGRQTKKSGRGKDSEERMPARPSDQADYLDPLLEPLYRDIVAAIHEVDPDHPVFLAGAEWSSNFRVFGPPFAPNVAYTYHEFWSSTERDAIQKYIDFSNRYNVPVFLGESGELDDSWNTAFRTLHERMGIGWSFWTYKNMDSTSTMVSIASPAGWDAIVATADTPPERWSDATLPTRAAARGACCLSRSDSAAQRDRPAQLSRLAGLDSAAGIGMRRISTPRFASNRPHVHSGGSQGSRQPAAGQVSMMADAVASSAITP